MINPAPGPRTRNDEGHHTREDAMFLDLKAPWPPPPPNAQPEPAAPHAPLQKRRVVAVMLALALAGALGLTLLVGAPLAEPSLETVMARLPD